MFRGPRLTRVLHARRLLETNATRMNLLIDITPPCSIHPFLLLLLLLLFYSVLFFVCLFVLFCFLLFFIFFVVMRDGLFSLFLFSLFSQWFLLYMYNVSCLGLLSLSLYSDNTHQLQTKQFISINVC